MYCSSLKSVAFPESVEAIDNYAFSTWNNKLSSVYFFNKDCEIYDHAETFYTYGDCDVTFYGYKDSTAEKYANTYAKTFVELVEGDVSGDGELTISDVTEIQKSLAKITEFNQGQNILGDVNGDGKTTIRDVTYIQMKLAKLIDIFPN